MRIAPKKNQYWLGIEKRKEVPGWEEKGNFGVDFEKPGSMNRRDQLIEQLRKAGQ